MNELKALLTTITCNRISVLDSVIVLPRSMAGVDATPAEQRTLTNKYLTMDLNCATVHSRLSLSRNKEECSRPIASDKTRQRKYPA